MSFDQFHKDANKIFRILEDHGSVSLPPAFKTIVSDNISEIEHSTRLFKSSPILFK
jgi:hypothetical protein